MDMDAKKIVRKEVLSWHFLIKCLIATNVSFYLLRKIEAEYGPAPWWGAVAFLLVMGFLVAVIYDDVLEIPRRTRGDAMIRPSLPRPRPSWAAVIGGVLFVLVMVVAFAGAMAMCVGGL